MHLLYLIDGLDLSGAEQALAAMAPHWVGRGVTLDVGWFYDRRGLQDRLVEAGATLFDLTGPGGHLARARRARDLIRSRRPDLVPVFSFNSEGLWQGVGPQAAGDASARLSRWRAVLLKARAAGFQ